MESRRQRRVWKYLKSDSPSKLSSYLKKHRSFDVNFTKGRRQRSPLHVACIKESRRMVCLLLKHGADVLRQDRDGNTALHIAAEKMLLQRDASLYLRLVDPLRKACPAALNVRNDAGDTPQFVINRMASLKTDEDSTSSSEDENTLWREKIMDECASELYDPEEVLNDYIDGDEDFDRWAERMRKEYYFFRKLSTDKSSQSQENARAARMKEHEVYLANEARKKEEILQGKKRRYDEQCAAMFKGPSTSGSTKLGYRDMPWPSATGTVEEMFEVMFHGIDRDNKEEYRKAVRKQQVLWHPDKFSQRCKDRLKEGDKDHILNTVTALSQKLNVLARTLSS